MTTDYNPRCKKCSRVMAGVVTRPWKMKCRRCGAKNSGYDIPFEKKPIDKPVSRIR